MLQLLLLGARLVLAGIFVLSGVAKLVDRAGSLQAMLDFGLPNAVAPALGLSLPVAELAASLALLPRPTAWWGAFGVLALLLAFGIGIGYNLARGKRPDCHCFGQLHSTPIGWQTLARNGVLALVAGFILVAGRSNRGYSLVAWLGALSVVERIGLVLALFIVAALAAQGWLLFQVLRQNGRILLRLEALEAQSVAGSGVAPAAASPAASAFGLPVGSTAPAFALHGLDGGTQTLGSLRAAGKPTVLAFTDPVCGPCNALLPELARYQRDYAGKLTLAIISRGTVAANNAKVTRHGLAQVLLQEDREVAQTYQVSGTPSAVIVRSDGTIGSSLAQGADQIRSLIATAVGLPALAMLPGAAALGGLTGLPLAAFNGNGDGAQPPTPALPKIGDPAPALSLPDLSGKTVDLADFHGHATAVAFWNPGCGFCQRMLGDLKAWEDKTPEGAPKLLVVSTGTPQANQAMGLRLPIVLDQGFAIGRAFGASGTPSAVLVDEEGRLASEVTVGAPGVLALLGAVTTHA